MSKAPPRPAPPKKASVGSRSYTRRRRSELERAARARISHARDQQPPDLRALLRRVPTAAWVCALIALLNGFAWSLITPPFQGKDEIDHYAYVEYVAESGKLPKPVSNEELYSHRETLVMSGLRYYQVRFTPYAPSLASRAEQHTLMEDVNTGKSLEGYGEAGRTANEAPLYYVLEIIPYSLGGSNMLTKLELMRLFGGLLAAITVLLTFFFLRELLPRVPWAATVGAVCVALQPLFGFMSGTVNPDVMLFTVAAAVFLCLARAFRRGFTRRLAITLGVCIAVGFLTKLNFIGFAVGIFAGLVVLAAREAKSRGWRESLQSLTIAGGIGIAPVLLYVLRNALTSKPTLGSAVKTTGQFSPHTLIKELSYIWEVFLPRLPGMTQYFKGITTWKDVWFDRSVGLYGWMDTMFPGWVDSIALVLAGAVALLCGRELLARRHELRARLPELGIYVLIIIGVLAMIGFASYRSDLIEHELSFGEPRYLLPMLPLLGAVIMLAVRGAGRRWAPVVGAAMIMLFLGHDIFSQLQVIARYYG